MLKNTLFFKNIIDFSDDHISVIDTHGNIVYVNEKWNKFGENNGLHGDVNWCNYNYFDVCRAAMQTGESFGKKAFDSVSSALTTSNKIYYLEYPCHSKKTKRWFSMQSMPMDVDKKKYVVIIHKDITRLKNAENIILSKLKFDPLTSLANVKYLNEFVEKELDNTKDKTTRISLLLIKIKGLDILEKNKNIENQQDVIIKETANYLKSFSRESKDLCARINNTLMCIVWADISLSEAKCLAEDINHRIHKLKSNNLINPIPHDIEFIVSLSSLINIENTSSAQIIDDAIELIELSESDNTGEVIFYCQ